MQQYKTPIIYLIVMTLILFSSFQPAALSASRVIPVSKLGEVEEILYGKTAEGAVVDRISELEKTLYGNEREGSLIERSEQIIDYVLAEGDRPSLIFIINTLEWSLTSEVQQKDIISRIEEIETVAFGQDRSGPLVDRLNRLVRLGLPQDKVPAQKVTIPANTDIKVKILNKISSSSSQKGQIINFKVIDEVKVDNKLVIPSGLTGKMRVTGVKEAGQMGKDGLVKLEIEPVTAIDGTKLAVSLKKDPEEGNFSRQLALGAGVLTSILIDSPAGLVVGYFVQGKEQEIPAESELVLETEGSYEIYGLITD